MQNVKNTIIDRLLGMLAPHPCCCCGALERPLCDNCKYDITRLKFRRCIVCGSDSSAGVCESHGAPYQKGWVVGLRHGPLRALTEAFKFTFQCAALQELVWLLDRTVPSLPQETVVVAVPTRRAHVRRRGYDHAWLLANAFACGRGLECLRVGRRAGNFVQHQLDRRSRFEATKGNFFVTGSLSSAVPYLIIDDVVTTGATVAAMAEALRMAGAQTIWVAAVAYQPLD